MNEKICFIKIDGQVFNLNEVNSCITGNWIGRVFQRLKLKIKTGVSITDKKVDDSLEKLSLTGVLKICAASKIKINNDLGGIFEHSKKVIDSKLAGRVKHLKDESTLSKKLGLLGLTLAKTPILARFNDQLHWVVKNEEGKWQTVSRDGLSNTVLEPNTVQLIDLDTAQVEISEDGKFVINVNQQMLVLPDGSARTVSYLKGAIEDMKAVMPQAPGVRFTFRAPSLQLPLKSIEPALGEPFITDSSRLFHATSEHAQVQSSVMLQSKGYLPKGEYGADWAIVSQLENWTLAIIADAAGNKEDSHKGSVELTRRFRQHLLSNLIQLRSQSLSLDQVQTALIQAIIKTQFETRSDPKSAKCTMACTLVLPGMDGNSHAVGFRIGDSRVMLKKADGSALDLSPTDYSSPYSDPGGTFGGNIPQIQPIYRKLDSGDTLILGSDGFGDNMEAKTLGKTPAQALQELYQSAPDSMSEGLRELAKNPPPWIREATSPSYWVVEMQGPEARTIRNWHNRLLSDQKKLLQELHDLYSATVLAKMDRVNIASTVYQHCTQSHSVQAGLFCVRLEKKIQKQMQDLSRSVFQTKEDYEKAADAIIARIVWKNMAECKRFAVKITGMQEDSEEMKNLFIDWKRNPKQAYEWLSFRMGKPDDFSLIALTVK